jgi:O-acetyl-ADP-ribose deacetylase
MTEKKINGKTIRLVKGDVTDIDVDAFTYYATEDLILGSGYGTAISIRGGPKIQEELQTLGPVQVGEAVVSHAGEMKASYIIHAVGPKFQEKDEEAKLRKTMVSALKKAEEKGIKRLAFPPMGSGFYGIPADLCARVMLETIRDHLAGASQLDEVIICTPDTREVKPFTSKLEAL